MVGRRGAIGIGIAGVVAIAGLLVVGAAVVGPDPEPTAGGVDEPLPDLLPWQEVAWGRLDPPSMGGPLAQVPVSITRIPGGLVVLGHDAEGVEDAQRQVGSVWVSSDGRAWDQHLMLEGVPAGDVAELRLAAAGPEGLLVVGGVCCSVEGPAAWLAPTGLAFERVPFPGPRASFMDVEAGPPGFVAVGATWDGDPNDPSYTSAIWSSPDGRTWSAVDRDAADLGPGWANDVLWTGSAWIVVGSTDDGDTSDGAVWRSLDGAAWERVAIDDPAIAGPDEQGLSRVLPMAGGLFAQGAAGSHEDRERCEELLGADVVGVDGAVLALDCGWGETTHWTSPDGLTWTRSPRVEAGGGEPLPPAPGGRRLISHRVLTEAAPGLVVVDAEGSTPDGHDLVGTWVSADGATWRPVGDAGAFEDGMYLQDVVAVDRTLIGIAEGPFDAPTGTDIVIWIGTVRP